MKPTRLAPALTLLWALSATVGCATAGTLETASTLGAGRLQVGLEAGVQGNTALKQPLSAFTSGTTAARFDTSEPQVPVPVPHAAVALRFGVADRLDLAARVGTSGLGLGMKLRLSPEGWDRLFVSLSPALSVQALPLPALAVTATLPVLVGIRLRERDELVLTVRAHEVAGGFAVPQLFAGGAAHVLSVGGSVGYALAVAPHVRVMPEVALLVPVVAHGGLMFMGHTGGGGQAMVGPPSFQLGCALLLD